jgi:predicted AAA+ superfamily ATPase
MTRVDKPALLRQLFELGCAYSGQILSYQKMVGQLQDAGNTTTLSHYLELLSGAGLLAGLPKYSGSVVRQRAASPKLLVLNTGLMTAGMHLDLAAARADREVWGRLVESAVGAFLYNEALLANCNLYYWAGRNRELDFVLAKGPHLVAVEVKSTLKKARLPGITEFTQQFPVTRKILVGAQGIPIEEFLLLSVPDLF